MTSFTFFRSHIQTLKKEITDQEASFKIQLSAANKKASDHWVYLNSLYIFKKCK